MFAMSTFALLSGVSGGLVAALVAISVALSNTRERVAKLEEWVRVHDLTRKGE